MSTTDIIGYFAAAILMFSFTNKEIKTLRYWNSTACILFIVYGFLLNMEWPIIISNGFILVTNIYYLFFKRQL